jgi:hypothetical protein
MRNRNPSTPPGLEPAFSIIRLLGGPYAVADYLGVNRVTVGKWSMHGTGGTNGRIPEQYHTALLTRAAEMGVPVNRISFLPLAEQHGAVGAVRLTKKAKSFIVVPINSET